MTRAEILENLKEIMKYTVNNPDEVLPSVTEESDLYTDLGLTSVGMLYSIIAIEEMFSVSFENVNFQDFKTVGDVVGFIAGKQA